MSLDYLHKVLRTKDLRIKILWVIGCLFLYRVVSQITVPGVEISALQNLMSQNELLGVFSILTGGNLQHFSIVLMGLTPYINASIIMQLMTVVIPRLEEIKKEGDSGQKKINQWTRYLTVPLAFLQSYGMIVLLNRSAGGNLIANTTDWTVMLPLMITISAGTLFLVWLGEIMTEKGIGNGISLLIFGSILSGVPPIAAQSLGIAQFDQSKIIPIILITAITIALIAFVVQITEGVRNIPITYARRGAKSSGGSLPIRVNQAGMVPIIFSVSLITFPVIISQFGQASSISWIRTASQWILAHINTATPGPLYMLFYFAFVIAFTFFYVSITFQTDKVAENIQKRGGFIPGIRPGRETAEYLMQVSNRLNLWGGISIGGIAVLPMLLQSFFANQSFGSVPLLISGAGIIIVVGVVLELRRQIHANLVMHDYEKYK